MKILTICLIACALYGCSNSTDPPSSTATGETLLGTVQVFGATSGATMSAAAVHVTIQNTPFEAVTDTGGHFRIENIPAGVYNIIFSKPGFDSMVYPVHHVIGVGTDIINDAYIVQESSDSIELNAPAYVFTVSVSKLVLVIDTTITNVGGKLDTTVLQHDS